MAFIFTPSLAWILIVVSLVVLGMMAILIPQVFKAYDERQHRLDAVNNTLQENLSGVRVVKAFVREKLEIERFTQRADNMRHPAFTAAFRVAILSPMLTGIAQIAIAFTIGYGGVNVLAGTGLNVGELITFMQYLNLVVMPLAFPSCCAVTPRPNVFLR